MTKAFNHTLNILLADDDPDDSMLFLQAVEELAIPGKVSVMDDGMKLVNHISHSSNPDIIFLDMNMPFMTGLECLQTIRQKESMQQVPVIIYSTSHNPAEIRKCFEHGANYYVVKPFSFDSIRQMVKSFCSDQLPDRRSISYNDFVVSFD
jgi:CheY-like chemotaxis protein